MLVNPITDSLELVEGGTAEARDPNGSIKLMHRFINADCGIYCSTRRKLLSFQGWEKNSCGNHY
jgi:hypothetical protein